MADDNDDLTPEENAEPGAEENAELDADALADSVAEGVTEASSDDEAVADEWAAAMAEAGEGGEEENAEDDWAAAMAEAGEGGDDVRQVELDELEDEGKPVESNGPGPELDVILDIPVRISMEVGATQIPIRNLLQLNQGSVVELDRLAGEPLDVMVNGTLIAHGEVVMVNDKFGIRLTDVVSQSERIQRLR
ncbi:flagellar motor switch protein FliN [Thalassolituus marinus]|uniref:Flagellar motor switch protein FliN n=1 Tax=Thalassolituus marinus TaxID=671053 RepID=A0ABS7ZM93_9GAMM|nr:flagellar motor switch protein FliN [Thalassolituus marinus]MCA6062815.1 flagellar motor switch protein FliN [Thalassolituus marinus]